MGLYVYGALLMSFSFVVGLGHSPWLVALAIVSAAISGLAEVCTQMAIATGASSFRFLNASFAALSWIVTAWTVICALYVTIGGL